MTPIQLYTFQTPNGHKASIMLEEVGLPYEVHVIDIEKGDQKTPEYLAINPNNKIPAIVDPDRNRTVFESGAILFYLAERAGKLLPATEDGRTNALTWVLFQAAHVGPNVGRLWDFKLFDKEKNPAVIAKFEREVNRVYDVLNGQLGRHAYLAGDAYGISDIMTWPWIHAPERKGFFPIGDRPNLRRWYEEIKQRPAVQRGLKVPVLSDGIDH
jgi:GST-like protein